MTNFEVIMKEHPQFVKECLAHCRVQSVLQAVVEGKNEHDLWYSREDDGDEMDFLNAEYVQLVLDNIEKDYLGNFIRPFKNRVEYISKEKDNNDICYIFIKLKNDSICLPYFSGKSGMYKGMTARTRYTLKDLGL